MPSHRVLLFASLIAATITTSPRNATAITKIECDLDMFHCLSLAPRRLPAAICIEAHTYCLTLTPLKNDSWESRSFDNGGSRQYLNAK